MSPIWVPLVALQGIWLKSTLRLAGPAAGASRGTAEGPPGSALRMAVVGDSTAAGHGVDTHDDGFAACLARALATRYRRPVAWEAFGQLGATSRRVRYRLVPRLPGGLDLAVLLAGGNDVLAGRRPDQWGEDLTAIVGELAGRAERVVVVGTPPFALFPSLPGTLGRYLGERAAALDRVSQRVCAQHPRASWASPDHPPPPDFFATDRFHPSAAGYRAWASAVADRITGQ